MCTVLKGRPAIEASAEAPQYRIQSAYDALRLLEIIATAEAGFNASELAVRVGDHRNRVFRLLRTLEEAGYILQEPVSRAYRPTLKLVSLGHAVSRSTGLETMIKPVMEELRIRTGETVYLVGHEGDEAVALINLESSHLNRISAQPGRRWLLGQGAAGQALLLVLPTQKQHLEQHPELKPVFARALERYKRDKVTFVDGRHDDIHDEGVMAIATPIVGYSRQCLALAVAWPVARSSADYDTFREMLLNSALEIRGFLGGEICGLKDEVDSSHIVAAIRQEVAKTD